MTTPLRPATTWRTWVLLAAAIVLELAGIVFLKRSLAFALLVPAMLGYLAYGAAFALLSRVMEVLSASTTYVLWNGCGSAGVTLGGWLLFGDRLTGLTVAGIALAVVGAILINTGERAPAITAAGQRHA